MKTLSTLLAFALILGTTATVNAQFQQQINDGRLVQLPNMQLPNQIQSQVQSIMQQTFQQPYQYQQPYQIQQPVQQNMQQPPFWRYPSHPMITTRNQITGINPFTGGLDTQNTQVNNTYFDPTRELGRGSQRFVQRPVYDVQGRQIGMEQGMVWTNPITGVEHGELKTTTPNDKGGVHNQYRAQSAK